MGNGYRPKWSENEVVAFFYLNLSESTARPLGEALGYEYLGKQDDSHRFRVPEGKAGEACKRLESFEELVEWAEPVDLKMESRCQTLDEAVQKMRGVDYCTPNRDYKEQIDEIVKHLYKVK